MNLEPIRLDVMGPLRLTVGQQEIPRANLVRRGARELLAYLSVAREHRVRKEEVIDVLWPDASADAASNKLYMALHALRSSVEPNKPNRAREGFIRSSGLHIELDAERVRIDADEFSRLTSGASGQVQEADLVAAVELYRGPLLGDDMQTPWVVPHREDFRIRFHKAALHLSQRWSYKGEFERAISLLLRIVRDDVTNEAARRQLILLTAQRGDRPEALRHFEQLARALAENLGVKPDAETLKLVDRVRRGDVFSDAALAEQFRTGALAADARSAEPPRLLVAPDSDKPAAATVVDRYPVPASSHLEARARDVESLLNRVQAGRRVRLLLHGLPGVGKSALAANVAAELSRCGRKVAWICAASVGGEGVIGALRELDGQASRGLTDIVFIDALQPGDLARIAMQMESFSAGVFAIARLPFERFPGIHYRLAPLRCAGAQAERLSTIEVESGYSDAERLFLMIAEQNGMERGGTAEPLVGVSLAQLRAVCRHLDGLPALHQLAARRLVYWSVAQLEQALRKERVAVLSGPLPGRHFSEQDELATVVTQLGADVQTVLCALSSSEIPLSAAEVASIARLSRGAVDAALEALCSASLVQRELRERASQDFDPWPSARFAPLSGPRWLAHERLAPAPRLAHLRQSYVEFVLGRMQAASNGTAHPDSVIRWADEASGVLDWAIEAGDHETPAVVLGALRGLWLAAGVDGRLPPILEAWLQRPDLPVTSAALAHLTLSVAHMDRGDLRRALASARAAQSRCLDAAGSACSVAALLQEARVQRQLGHRPRALELLDQAAGLMRTQSTSGAPGRCALESQTLSDNGANSLAVECQLERAANLIGTRGAASQSRALVGIVSMARDVGESALLVRALVVRSRAALVDARPDLAVQALDEAYSIAMARGLPRILGSIACHRGTALLEQGEIQAASESFQSALALAGEHGDMPTSCVAFRGLGAAALLRGERELGLAAFQQALAISRGGRLPREEYRCLVMIAVTQLAGGDPASARETLRRALMPELGTSAKELSALLEVAAASFLRERDGLRVAGLLQRVSVRLQSSMGLTAPRSSQLLLRSVLGDTPALPPHRGGAVTAHEPNSPAPRPQLQGRVRRLLRAVLEVH